MNSAKAANQLNKGVFVMMKKTIAVLLTLCAVCCCLLPAAAANEFGVIRLKLNSDIAGLSEQDAERLMEIQSDNVVYRIEDSGPVLISNYAGTADSGKLKAGRTYYVYYMLRAADGYTLPEKLEKGDVEIDCGKGVTVISTQITTSTKRNANDAFVQERGVMIYAQVVVDGNVFQRVFGWLTDQFLKLRAWSLY